MHPHFAVLILALDDVLADYHLVAAIAIVHIMFA
jgi:hypothetical protein